MLGLQILLTYHTPINRPMNYLAYHRYEFGEGQFIGVYFGPSAPAPEFIYQGGMKTSDGRLWILLPGHKWQKTQRINQAQVRAIINTALSFQVLLDEIEPHLIKNIEAV